MSQPPATRHTRPTVVRAAPSNSINVSSHPTVLRGTAISSLPSKDDPAIPRARSVAQPSPETVLRLDPDLAAHVQSLVTTAADDAYASGVVDGRTFATERIDTLTRAIDISTEQVRSLTVDHRGAFTDDVASLAESIAAVVLDRTPHDGGQAVLEAVRAEFSNLTDTAITLSVHVDDMAVVAAGITRDGVEIAVDPKLQPGEVVISTQWSTIERTRSEAWSAIRAALADDDA